MFGAMLVIFFYVLIGYILFRIGLSQFGGEEAYLETLKQEGHEHPIASYRFACFLFLTVWPYFLIRGIFGRNEEEDE